MTKQIDEANFVDDEQEAPVLDSLENKIVTDLDSVRQTSSSDGSNFRLTSNATGDDNWPLTDDQWEIFNNLRDDPEFSEQQIIDSLHVENETFLTQYVVKQIVRVYKHDKEYLAAAVVQNLSLMMFIMLPAFALILKLLYIRRKVLYINHLIHSIHMHSFAFLMYSLSMVIMYYWVDNEALENLIFLLTFVTVTTYAYISFLKVYQQKWLKTLIKFWIQGLVYFYVLMFALIFEVLISFLLF